MTLTKNQIANSVHTQLSLPKNRSFELVESVPEIIKKTIESGENVLTSGFGKFCVQDKKKRGGRNPQTGEQLMLDARRVLTFRCSEKVKDKINDK